MIYLDANAFYWYFGREKLPLMSSIAKLDVKELCRFLDLRKDKGLPASVLIEIIVHFRDYPDVIKKVITFVGEKGFKIYNNVIGYCFTSEKLTELRHPQSMSQLKQYAYELLDKKIEIEVYHTYIFLQTVSLLYADYYLKSCNDLAGEIKDKVLSYLGREMSKELKEVYLKNISSTLKSGYSDDKAQQYLKNEYIDLLVQNCIIFRVVIDTVPKVLNNGKNLFAEMRMSAETARKDGCTDPEIMSTIVNTLTTNSAFLKDAETQIPDMFLERGYSKHQADYLQLMMQAWLERGQKLRKNDIFDMLCVGALDKVDINPKLNVLVDQSSYLISFDETMMGFICKNSGNASLINKFVNP